jgi:hypothetical protein
MGRQRLNVFTPKDPEFEARMRASFAKHGLMKTMGAPSGTFRRVRQKLRCHYHAQSRSKRALRMVAN